MAENTIIQPDAFNAFVVLFRYAESQAKKNCLETAVGFDAATIIAALRKLYNTKPDLKTQYWTAHQILTGLEQILAQSGQEALLGNLVVRENIQILGLLLESILAETAIPIGITPYFTRLQFPLMIAALADPTLLEPKPHPARELLNQLASLSQAANAQGIIDNPQLLEALDQAIGGITVDSATRFGVFAEALDALSKLTAPLIKSFAMRLERVVDTCQGVHRLDQARLLVGKEIDSRLGGKSVPKCIVDLLAAGWQQQLVLTCLRRGTDDEEWRRELELIDHLLKMIGKNKPSTQTSRSVAHELKTFILDRLYGVGAEASTAKRLADEIENLLDDNGKYAPDYVNVPSADVEREEREASMRNRLQGFSVGDWLKFASARNVWIPLRLTWIGQDPPRYVFVNQKGVKSLDLDAEKFVQILDEKKAGRIENLDELTIVERVCKSLLYTLRERMR